MSDLSQGETNWIFSGAPHSVERNVFFSSSPAYHSPKASAAGKQSATFVSRVVTGRRTAVVVLKGTGGEDESWRRKTTSVH